MPHPDHSQNTEARWRCTCVTLGSAGFFVSRRVVSEFDDPDEAKHVSHYFGHTHLVDGYADTPCWRCTPAVWCWACRAMMRWIDWAPVLPLPNSPNKIRTRGTGNVGKTESEKRTNNARSKGKESESAVNESRRYPGKHPDRSGRRWTC